jgi:hypothetical protein
MTARENKLLKLTLGQMVLINSVVIIVFMTVNSFVCPDGLIGGDCVKQLDNGVFFFQMIANFLFAGYYLNKIDKGKWVMLLINIFLTTIIYIVAGTLHSISKAGLF